ncbi:putative glycerol-1-phosphate prenyltransferase [Gillisia sp. Hel_I_86]|uniref:geranylgeranylglyceryl/heptaprenylglyceryl phosphate synthase n=1 Tax=Gillisia sp. Hel_I_86 TaxID=1249981 RepID=UPI0011999585|nr:geranylgeranylglyceryl/heptaprenylglyceryl phosphate synthase [Gillisia sp. Hel_I_86]TVZ26616.1 putative glycerol-1-phosphate prenyltransferase [Gillisia sp. Hel_I_86]
MHTATIYENLSLLKDLGQKQLTVLIDPDKFDESQAENFLYALPDEVTHIFVGGSTVEANMTDRTVAAIKCFSDLPIIIFPGDYTQITSKADGILFLSLLSGRNPEYLIEQQVKSVTRLKNSNLEIIPTGYILIDGGNESAVQRISNTKPMPQNNVEAIVNTALAGQYSGKQLIYLEAGSGATNHVSVAIIKEVKKVLSIPLIVGGGIKNSTQLNTIYKAGADMAVIGTAFEKGAFH